MTKKDFIKIADVLSLIQTEWTNTNQTNCTIREFVVMLQQDNPRFDTERFITYIETRSGQKLDGLRGALEYINA